MRGQGRGVLYVSRSIAAKDRTISGTPSPQKQE